MADVLGPPSRQVPPSQGEAAVGVADAVGICLSGGGVRAAAFGLGALQAMQEQGLLTGEKKAHYLSAVSGGSYITGALAMVARGAMPGEENAQYVVPADDPFARGTPEEQYVRNHTTYLAHGPGGPFAYVGRLLGGILLNIVFLTLLLHLLFRPAGWLYGWALPGLRQLGGSDVEVDIPLWLWWAPPVLLGAGAITGLVQIAVRWRRDEVRKRWARWSAVLLVAGSALAVMALGVPKLLELLRDVVARLGGEGGPSQSASQAAVRSTQRLGVVAGSGVAGVTMAAMWALRASADAPPSVRTAERWLVRKLRSFGTGSRSLVLNLMAALFGPVLLLALAVAFLNVGAANTPFARRPGWASEVAVWLVVGLVLAVMWYFADLVSWSLHPLYKRRLSSTFALRRVLPPARSTPMAESRPYSALYRLSDSQPPHLPKVLICGAANISDYGRTPTGSDVVGFVFSADEIGGPLVGRVPMKEYERAVGRRARDFTLPAAMSISGAAFSPSMGKMTRAPLRFLFALLNLRLGVWLPNPERVARARDRPREQLSKAELRDHRLAVDAKSRLPINPRVDYLLRELFGRNHADSRFIYVSDGGHYENLGLVELLRRGCTTVWCVDASGEPIDSFGTIAQAVAIARAELAVDIDIDVSEMGPDPQAQGAGRRFVRRTHVVGTIRYRNGESGRLVIIKAGVPADAPIDILHAHAKWSAFPCDPTLNQLYKAERFDAYRALGYFATDRALSEETRP